MDVADEGKSPTCASDRLHTMADIKIPTVGESISTALISTWHKSDGEAVAVGDLLLTLETDKVSTELLADAEGVLRIGVPAGTEVAIGAVVGAIEAGGVVKPAASPPAAAPVPAQSAKEAMAIPAAADDRALAIAEPLPKPVAPAPAIVVPGAGTASVSSTSAAPEAAAPGILQIVAPLGAGCRRCGAKLPRIWWRRNRPRRF